MIASELLDEAVAMLANPLVLGVLATLLVLALLVWRTLEIVPDGERRALTVDGESRGLLEPGVHVVRPFGTSTTSIVVEPQLLTAVIDGAETSDGGAVNVEATVEFQVTDPETALQQVDDPARRFLQDVELAVNNVVGSFPVLELQDETTPFSAALEERLAAETSPYGITIHDMIVGSVTVSEA